MINGELHLPEEKTLNGSLGLSGKLNTKPEERFDRLTRLAVRMFGVSMAAIIIADTDCYRFKSTYGFAQTQAPVEEVLSRRVVDGESVLHVPDATLHEKFMNSPMVVGSPFVRFYLGVPLLNQNGKKAGVFCLMDTSRKVFEKSDFASFVDFSELVQKELVGSEQFCPAMFEQGFACPVYKTNQRFQKFAVNVPGMVYQQVLHPDGSDEYLYLSPGAGELYGVEYQSLLKNPKLMLKRFHPDDIRELTGSLEVAIRECRQWNWECRIITPSGKVKWLQGMANPEKLPDGDILWDGLVLDVTERKLAEERIRTMSIAVEQSASTIVITDTDGRVQYVNKKFSEITGYTADEVMGENPRILNSGKQAKDYYTQLWNTILAGNQWIGEFCNKKKNGELFWESVTIAPVRNERGILTNFIAIKEDITSRMNAEARLRDSEQMLASIFSTLKTGVFLTDKDGYFTSVNDAFSQICGYDQGELIGVHFTTILPDEHKQRGEDIHRRFFIGQTTVPSEWTIDRKQGQRAIVKVSARLMDREDASRYMVASVEDITEQKRVERALQRSEENFRKIVETASEGIWKTDRNEKIIFVNPGFAQMLGYQPGELLDQSIWSFIPKHTLGGGLGNSRQSKQNGSRKDYPFKCKSGSYRWGLISTSTLYDDSANEEGTLWMVSDITDRKYAEDMLVRKNRLLRGVTNSSRHLLTNPNFDSGISKAIKVLGITSGVDRVFVFQSRHDDCTGKFLMTQRFNWAHYSNFDDEVPDVSYEADFTVWKNWFSETRQIVANIDDLPAPERKYFEANDVKSVLIVPIVIAMEVWGFIGFAKSTDNHEWTEIEQTILVAAAGNISAAIARKNAVEALYESENRHRSLVDSVSEVIFQIDLQGNWSFLNPAWEEIMQYTVQESLGKKVTDFVHHDDRDNVVEKMTQMRQPDKSQCRNEIRLVTKNGEERWMEVMAQKVADPSGNIGDVSGILYDVTEHKRAIERQAMLLKGLNDANRELKEFAYVVSHDLKAPLRAIGSLSSWLYTDYADKIDETGREQLDLLMGRVKRMHDLIEGILQYSRIGRVKEDVVWVELGEVVRQAAEMVVPPEGIKVEIKGELPKVRADRTRMQQVFQNLLSNAVKYMDKAEGLVEVGSRESGESREIYVKDNGPGIEKKYHEKIFQIFQTLSPRDERESTGIGLTIVKKVVEGYGGEVRVESEVGKGSVFWVRLPKEIRDMETRNDMEDINV